MPTAREVPPIEVMITEDAPSPLNPLGLKGAGEGGANAVGARHRGGDRRRARHARRGDRAAGHAAAAARAGEAEFRATLISLSRADSGGDFARVQSFCAVMLREGGASSKRSQFQ